MDGIEVALNLENIKIHLSSCLRKGEETNRVEGFESEQMIILLSLSHLEK